jgi:hypothetical protein
MSEPDCAASNAFAQVDPDERQDSSDAWYILSAIVLSINFLLGPLRLGGAAKIGLLRLMVDRAAARF